jgi:hypothetical protein
MAADGQKVSDLVLGVPLVLKYDMATGGYILVATLDDEYVHLGQKVDVERAIIDLTGSAAGENALVAAVPGESIRVSEVMLVGSAAMNIRFLSGYSGTYLTGAIDLAAAGDGFFAGAPDSADLYHFTTMTGAALVLDRDAGGQVGGWLLYYTE